MHALQADVCAWEGGRRALSHAEQVHRADSGRPPITQRGCTQISGTHRTRTCTPLPQELSAPHALAKRDGKWQDVTVAELVPGDLIALKGGDIVPADCVVGVGVWVWMCLPGGG